MIRIPLFNCNIARPLTKLLSKLTLTVLLIILTTCSVNQNKGSQLLASFVDSSSLKPSIILIVPQSFKVPTSQIQTGDPQREADNKLQQFVALINNVQDERTDQALRSQYKKLTLQVRDAKSPISGQLFYEHVFDYFPPNPKQQHLLIPINVDQISPTQVISLPNSNRSYAAALNAPIVTQTVVNRPTQLIISIRPHQLDSGFGSDSIEFVRSAPIPVEPVPSSDGRRSFAIVQTDKPVYKPEDKVRIRSLVMNENFRPVTKDELRLQVRNPHKFIVEEIRFPNANNQSLASDDEPLYLDHVFEFPPEPMLGTWTVHLVHSDPIANDTTSFEVKEYVLPTYEITFESPKYILPSTQIISGSIIAKYQHGKPVQGRALLKFGYKESFRATMIPVARSSIKNVDPITGRVDYNIKSQDFYKVAPPFPSITGSRLFIEATVIETATGHREVAQDTSCTFITMPYRFSFADSIEDFKAGLTQTLTVEVLEMQSQRPAPAGARITAEYKDQNGTLLGASSLAANNQPVDFRQRLDTEALVDSEGRATFNIGPVRDDITIIQVRLRWINSTDQEEFDETIQSNMLASGRYTLVKHESSKGWISIMNKGQTNLNVGEQFISDLLIRDTVVIPQKIFYTISARGQILALETLDPDGLVRFTITEAMMPSFRLVLFALTYDSVGLLSDSMRINVYQDMNCGLTMRYKSNSAKVNGTTFRPNEIGKIAIQARQGDVVSLIGVDSAVYTLNNRSRLEFSRIVQRVKRLDPGCGFGGGKNNLDVFYNAGLMLFTDVTSDNPNEKAALQLGSSCLISQNQLNILEDIQLGYSRPAFSAAAQLNRPRSLELAAAVRQKFSRSIRDSGARHSRPKREVDVASILKRYKDPYFKSCCRLGTLEDLPQRRNCSVRAKIVYKYTVDAEFSSCATVYLDCCRAVFGEHLLLSSVLSARDNVEPVVRTRVVAEQQSPQFNEAISLANVGHLDHIEEQTLIRRDFRETWLFELVSVESADGSALLDVQLPHSITTWSISAMALNKYHPMCIMPKPLKIIAFQEIFVHISMPYKVIQGEQIDLVATLFNYSPVGQEVLVYMYGVEDICSDADPGERSDRKRIRIEKFASQSVLFPMIPLKTGKYPIKIVALTPSSGNSDIVERQLNVVAKGKPVTEETTFSLDPMNYQRRSKRSIQTGNLVDEIDSSRGLQRSKIRLQPTRDSEYIVPQTQECIVSVIGDKMGQSVQTTMLDVENLIRLPHGCGEQVMIYLAPTLYTARYLSAVNKLSGDLRWRAIRYIQSGYKRILNFRKENGAFSAFARRDPSIWLTAFIAKMLCQTERAQFIADEVHVDKNVINSALNWLVGSQNNETGTWVELNPVYHREILGGVLKENALTAFVTLTLNECIHHSPDLVEETDVESAGQDSSHHQHTNGVDKLKQATQKAEQALALEKYKAVKERNPYVLALTAYALSFSRPRDGAETLNDLMKFADRSQSRNQLFWRGDYSIETAAYALQALIELAPILGSSSSGESTSSHSTWSPGADAISISNWLTSRRSYSGAFESTQDTVVALEALSKLAQLQSTPDGNSFVPQSLIMQPSNLMCNVTINNRTRRSIEFGKDNAQILHTFKLETFEIDSFNGEMIDIVTSGNGLGTMSVKLRYNVYQEDDELCRFDIDSSIEEWQPKISSLSVSKPQDQSIRGDIKLVSENQSNDTIEDDYFKTFSKSMLSELNLVHLDQSISTTARPSSGKEVLRWKRYAAQMIDLSSKNNHNNSLQESWASKMVSNIKSKLPSWLSPISTSSLSTTPSSPTSQNQSNRFDTNSYLSDGVLKKTNTSRRSTQNLLVPMIVQPTGIPQGVKLNILSKQLDFNQNDTGFNHNSTSHKLVLLLRVCVHHLSIRRDSEMAVIEIGILSGFKPHKPDLEEITHETGTLASKYEISADQSLVVIYMSYIPHSGPYCLQFRLIRDSLVYNLQSGYIRAYEYYSPTHSCSNYYTPARVTDLIETRCDSSGQICQCAARSLCPSTKKLIDLGEIHSVNVTNARTQLVDLICSDRFDLVSLVRLKSVRYIEAAKTYKLFVKVKSDLKGNLTKIMDSQRQQKTQLANSVRKPQITPLSLTQPDLGSGSSMEAPMSTEQLDEEDTSMDYLSLSVDSSCVRNDPLLLHLAHPSQWKQGGELMILFGRYNQLEKRFFRITPKSSTSMRTLQAQPSSKLKPTVGSRVNKQPEHLGMDESHLIFEDSHRIQYSTTMILDKNSILHDMVYQAKVEPRESINNLIFWLELRSRRERWACPLVSKN